MMVVVDVVVVMVMVVVMMMTLTMMITMMIERTDHDERVVPRNGQARRNYS